MFFAFNRAADCPTGTDSHNVCQRKVIRVTPAGVGRNALLRMFRNLMIRGLIFERFVQPTLLGTFLCGVDAGEGLVCLFANTPLPPHQPRMRREEIINSPQ
jgi:hypothetical protein